MNRWDGADSLQWNLIGLSCQSMDQEIHLMNRLSGVRSSNWVDAAIRIGWTLQVVCSRLRPGTAAVQLLPSSEHGRHSPPETLAAAILHDPLRDEASLARACSIRSKSELTFLNLDP